MIKNYILKWLLLILSQLYFEVNSHPIKYISSFYSMLTCQNFAERNEWITKIYTQLLRFCNEKNFTVFIANQVQFCVLVLSSSLGVCSSSIRWIQYSSWYSASILMGMNRINHLWNTSETCNDINSHLLYTWTVCLFSILFLLHRYMLCKRKSSFPAGVPPDLVKEQYIGGFLKVIGLDQIQNWMTLYWENSMYSNPPISLFPRHSILSHLLDSSICLYSSFCVLYYS